MRRSTFTAVLVFFSFFICLHKGKIFADELIPINPSKKFSSLNSAYCCVQYNQTLAEPSDSVIYFVGVGVKSTSTLVETGCTIPVDTLEGGIKYYHSVSRAGVECGDRVLSTFTEPHPAKSWFFDGKSHSVILIGYRSLGDIPPGEVMRVYGSNGQKKTELARRLVLNQAKA